MAKQKNKIGTRNESSLHRTLKLRYAGPGGKTEVTAGEFVADGLSKNGEYIEVQTGNFAPLKAKVKNFTAKGKMKIIYPAAVTKYIEVFEPKKGKLSLLYRRKSPLKGSPWDLFNALIYAWELALFPGISIEIILADIAEKRVCDNKGSWRRKGVSIFDRELETLHGSIILKKKRDYARFVPFKKGEEFTSLQLAKQAGIKAPLARKTLYVLTKLGIVERTGKNGNFLVYKKL